MRHRFVFYILILLTSNVLAEDISLDDVQLEKISECLPAHWHITSTIDTPYPLGWKRISGSNGIGVRISRDPYSSKEGQIKKEGITTKDGRNSPPSPPSLFLVIMPFDFVAEHIDTRTIFKGGNLIPPDDPRKRMPDVAMVKYDQFLKLKIGYLFYNSASFKDWKSPINDITRMLNETSNQGMEPTSANAQSDVPED